MSAGLLAQAQQFKAATQEQQPLDPGTGLGERQGAHVNASTRIENSSLAATDVDKVPNHNPAKFFLRVR